MGLYLGDAQLFFDRLWYWVGSPKKKALHPIVSNGLGLSLVGVALFAGDWPSRALIPGPDLSFLFIGKRSVAFGERRNDFVGTNSSMVHSIEEAQAACNPNKSA